MGPEVQRKHTSDLDCITLLMPGREYQSLLSFIKRSAAPDAPGVCSHQYSKTLSMLFDVRVLGIVTCARSR
jgi:hypothetical protein